MAQSTPISQVMTTAVVTLRSEQPVAEAAKQLLDAGVDGAPVLDGQGQVVGMLSTDDLIVQDARIHLPTLINVLGATIELPVGKKHFEDDLRRLLGGTVSEVMTPEPVAVPPDATVQDVATLLHREGLTRVPVVADGQLVGIVARGDILRRIVADLGDAGG